MMVFIIIIFVVIVVIIIVSPSPSLSAPPQLLLLPRPCRAPALFLASSCTFLAPRQFLPSSCPLSSLLCFTILSSAPALILPYSSPAPASARFLLCSWPTPTLLPACSWSCQVQFGSLHHHQHLTTFFGTARAAFHGTYSMVILNMPPLQQYNFYSNHTINTIKKS